MINERASHLDSGEAIECIGIWGYCMLIDCCPTSKDYEATLHGIEVHFYSEIPILQHFGIAFAVDLYSCSDSGLKYLTLALLVLPGCLLAEVSALITIRNRVDMIGHSPL